MSSVPHACVVPNPNYFLLLKIMINVFFLWKKHKQSMVKKCRAPKGKTHHKNIAPTMSMLYSKSSEAIEEQT